MKVEDGIELLARCVNQGLYVIFRQDDWAYKFVQNVAEYTRGDKPLSTEQSRIILKLLRRERNWLLDRGVSASELDALLAHPTYRQAPYPSANVPREVRFLGGNLLGFRFKRNDEIVSDLRQCLPPPQHRFIDLWFHRDMRIWVVPVTRQGLDRVMNVIRDHRFDFDDEVAEYLAQCTNNRERPPAFVADRGVGVIAGQIYDCEFTAFWTRHVLGGQPV